MLLAHDFRRQAQVCAQLADDCDDPFLAERLRAMASDLLAKAEELKERQAFSASHNKEVVNRDI
jgi:DNA-binding PucR family transcriptional regulator